jgi:hypothetical protein
MSNIIYLRQRFEKMPVLSKSHICFASTRETLELQAAFSRIESPFLRRMIINIGERPLPLAASRQRIRLKLTHSSLRRLTMVRSASASSRSSGRDRATRLSRREVGRGIELSAIDCECAPATPARARSPRRTGSSLAEEIEPSDSILYRIPVVGLKLLRTHPVEPMRRSLSELVRVYT